MCWKRLLGPMEKAEGGFSKEFPEPSMIYRPRMCQTDLPLGS